MLQFVLMVLMFVALVVLLGHTVVLFFETFIPDLYAKPSLPKNKLGMTDDEFQEFESLVTGKSKEELESKEFHSMSEARRYAIVNELDSVPVMSNDKVVLVDSAEFEGLSKQLEEALLPIKGVKPYEAVPDKSKKLKKKKNKKKSKKSSKRRKK